MFQALCLAGGSYVQYGANATREEVTTKLPPLLKQGGYIGGADHNVPPDVTFENYCCYINTMREVAADCTVKKETEGAGCPAPSTIWFPGEGRRRPAVPTLVIVGHERVSRGSGGAISCLW